MASRTHPLSWKELCQYDKNPPKIALIRTKEIEQKYEVHRDYLIKNNIKIGDYINSKYFSNEKENNKYCFVTNTFPYACEDNIQHYLIWINPKFNASFPDSLNSSKFEPIVKMEVKKIFNDSECIFFENAMEFKSVKAIRHMHIFIKSN